jgi:phosphoribosylanthranilate isomerase
MWIKVCGMTSSEAVAAALEAGADAIGFVFAPSARQLQPARAARLAEPARGKACLVAVTLHPETALWRAVAAEFRPDILQTDQQDFAKLPEPLGCEALPVFRGDQPLPDTVPELLLYEGARSGTGRVADWPAAARLARRSRLVLAGGLHAGNVADAIATVRPWGVDVSSGVEDSPGVKSPQKIFEFVRAARAAFKELPG